MQPGNRRAVLAALLANLGIAIAKFVGWAMTGAASMLAEAVHSLADTGNQALLLWGSAAAARAPTPQHPFGHGRERYFWSFVVALVLFSLGGLFAIYEGIQKLQHPHELGDPTVAIVILGIGIVLESFSFRTAIQESRRVKGGQSWWSFVRHTRNPELPVVLLEDLGALVGLAPALLAISTAMWTGDPRFDALGSIAIGILLAAIAVVLAIEMKSLLIGEAAAPVDRERIIAALESRPEVVRIIHLRTQHIGPDELLVGAKIEFDDRLDVASLARAIDAAEDAVRAQLPIDCWIYLEPDLYVAEHTTARVTAER